ALAALSGARDHGVERLRGTDCGEVVVLGGASWRPPPVIAVTTKNSRRHLLLFGHVTGDRVHVAGDRRCAHDRAALVEDRCDRELDRKRRPVLSDTDGLKV